MSEQKHTPGPWRVTDSGVRDAGGYICHTIKATRYSDQDERYKRETAERAANARLIAAAPALLEALQTCHAGGYVDLDGDWCECLWFDKDKVRAALASAQGNGKD